jgi:hypothetical protein
MSDPEKVRQVVRYKTSHARLNLRNLCHGLRTAAVPANAKGRQLMAGDNALSTAACA